MASTINSDQITVVIQGNIRPETVDVAASVRRVLPGAAVVLSTFEQEADKAAGIAVDRLVLSTDPGPMPGYTRSKVAGPNNINRQIVSTQVGFAVVTTPFALKLRSDAILVNDNFIALFEGVHRASPKPRIVASSFFTRHPCGISGYTYHVSDWFHFGHTDHLKDLWSAKLMSVHDATWFDNRRHEWTSTPSARRFRGRFTPEQHICVQYAKRHGYVTPDYFNHRHPAIVEDAKRFLANEFIIDTPSQLGFVLPKYQHVEKSAYQRMDCVFYRDWLMLFDIYCAKRSQTVRLNKREAQLLFARTFRHFLSGGVLLYKWFEKRFRKSTMEGLISA